MYKFALEPVLNHREFIEENLRRDLTGIKKLLADERRRMRAYRKAKNTFLGELKQKQKQSITVSEMLLYVSFVERLSRDIEKQKEKVTEVERKFEQKLEDVIEARKKKKTLEQMKMKRWKAYEHELIKKEQDFLNEVAANKFSRRLQRESR